MNRGGSGGTSKAVPLLLLSTGFLACSPADRMAETRAPRAQAASATADAAPAAEPVAFDAKFNPYLRQVRAQRKVWQARRPRDYVYVVDEFRQIVSIDMIKPRVVVTQGRVVSGSSLEYGGWTALLQELPTMDQLFDRAEEMAGFGEAGMPARFEAQYDPQLGYPRWIEADGRTTIADDESGLRVRCFSTRPDGCRPVYLSETQCRRAGGFLSASDGNGCKDGGWSIGLVSDAAICCRTYSEGSHDELTAAQCRAAGGQEDHCTDDMLSVGSSQARRKGCCRRFVE